jgi:CRISPR-associated protein Cas2
MSLYVASYDITDDNRRVQIARILLDYGCRVQKSVFEVWLTVKQLDALKHRLGPILGKDDRFDLFPVDERGPRRRIGWLRAPNPYVTVTVVVPRDEGGKPAAGAKQFRIDDIPDLNRGLPLRRKIRYWRGGKCYDTPIPAESPKPAGETDPATN